MKEWLKENNLDQKYCGLVNIPNMNCTYGVYYDFAAYFKFEFADKGLYNVEDFDQWCFDMGYCNGNKFYDPDTSNSLGVDAKRVIEKKFYKYPGIVNPDNIDESNDVRLCSIPKYETPICTMTYNKDGYVVHCREYKEYKEWEAKRNPERYKSNLDQNYDGKNMCHCMRLTRMGKELALGQGFNVERTYDREYLLSIKNHELEYDEIMTQANKEKAEMEEAIEHCTLPEKPDYDGINEVLIKARMEYYG
jgi:hypothetical protein